MEGLLLRRSALQLVRADRDVARLLHLGDEAAAADRMRQAGLDEERVPDLDRDLVAAVLHRADVPAVEGRLEHLARHALLKAHVDIRRLGAVVALADDVPAFLLAVVAAEPLLRVGARRVRLQPELLFRVEQLDKHADVRPVAGDMRFAERRLRVRLDRLKEVMLRAVGQNHLGAAVVRVALFDGVYRARVRADPRLRAAVIGAREDPAEAVDLPPAGITHDLVLHELPRHRIPVLFKQRHINHQILFRLCRRTAAQD